MKRQLLPLFALLAASSELQAKWIEASSAHFVIYADAKPQEVEQFSSQLERFHSSLMLVMSSDDLTLPSPSNRVTVYVVKDAKEVREISGAKSKIVYAFYKPRAGQSFAIVPAIKAEIGQTDFSMIALLHEYVHHFQLSTSRYAWPRWLIEGSAEFFASAQFDKDGTVTIGMPANHRTWEIVYTRSLSARDMLDPQSYEKNHKGDYAAFYGKAWLLYHYLAFSEKRRGQLDQYLKLLQTGVGSAKAATASFGDLDQLERELDEYKQRGKMTALRMNNARLQPSPVTLRELSAGEAAIMPVRVRSRSGVSRAQAKELVPEARAIAARFPQDAAVLAALAEAEYDAGNDELAIAAADAALERDPAQVNAYVQKGYALFRMVDGARDFARAVRAAREPFIALNKIEPDHPLPLIYFYLGQRRLGPPTPLSIQALERAVEIAPFDMGLRFTLVRQQIQDKRYDEAAFNLAPIAYNPHASGMEPARTLLDRLQKRDALDPAGLTALLDGMTEAAKSASNEVAPLLHDLYRSDRQEPTF